MDLCFFLQTYFNIYLKKSNDNIDGLRSSHNLGPQVYSPLACNKGALNAYIGQMKLEFSSIRQAQYSTLALLFEMRKGMEVRPGPKLKVE